jgi:sugar phosphate isomerase/epimerase
MDPDQPKYDPTLKETIAALKGRDTIVWLAMPGRKLAAGSAEGDERAVGILREIADLAAGSRLRVSLYPHHAFYVESVDDALRLMRKADRPNVSVTFNLCHWLRVDRKRDLEGLLKRAMPHLTVVTINGADTEGDDWSRLIQPLGRGGYDMYGLLRTLDSLGYKGPIGFQGYGIKGDVRENLKESMRAWRMYGQRLAEEKGGSRNKG